MTSLSASALLRRRLPARPLLSAGFGSISPPTFGQQTSPSLLATPRRSPAAATTTTATLQQGRAPAGSPFSMSAPARALRSEADVVAELDAANDAWEGRVQAAIEDLVAKGYDRRLIWRQNLCWGDHDTFQHVNNVHYVRWFESARMRWGQVLSQYIDDEQRRLDILRGTGVSFILGGINVRYRRPLLYPDTVLIAQTVALPISEDRFTIQAIAWSVEQSTVASSADQLCVMYDYTKLRKCPIPDDLRGLMEEQGRRTAANQPSANSAKSPT